MPAAGPQFARRLVIGSDDPRKSLQADCNRLQ
jgi:hypothetical protein